MGGRGGVRVWVRVRNEIIKSVEQNFADTPHTHTQDTTTRPAQLQALRWRGSCLENDGARIDVQSFRRTSQARGRRICITYGPDGLWKLYFQIYNLEKNLSKQNIYLNAYYTI